MVSERVRATPGSENAAPSGETHSAAGTMYRVMLTGVRSEIETRDSFAIKFSVLAKAPLSKVKQIIRSLPVALWTGKSRSKAARILELVEEAGGKGEIVEAAMPVPKSDPGAETAVASYCGYCGFPLKESDACCDFCLTPIPGKAVERRRRIAHDRPAGIPRGRLIAYICIIAAGVIILLMQR